MKRFIVGLFLLAMVPSTVALAQTRPARLYDVDPGKVVYTKFEEFEAEVMFQVLDLKHTIDIGVLVSEKGFNRRLTRVTAKLVKISIPKGNKQALAESFLKTNANEIDLSVKYRPSVGSGSFSGSNSMFAETINAFRAAYKKNPNATFKGFVSIQVTVPPHGDPHIAGVYLSSIKVPEAK